MPNILVQRYFFDCDTETEEEDEDFVVLIPYVAERLEREDCWKKVKYWSDSSEEEEEEEEQNEKLVFEVFAGVLDEN